MLNRANDLYDEMEENTSRKPAIPDPPEHREESAEHPQAESEHHYSNLVIQASFKPLQNLGKETTPVEAEDFFKGLKSYFDVSKMERQPANIHQALMKTCVEKDLLSIVEPFIKPLDKIDELIVKLRETHDKYYTQIILQLKFMSMKQKDGQTPGDFMLDLEKAQRIAKMNELTADQLLAIVALNGIKNEKLKDYILKDKDTVNAEEISKSILKFEAAELTKEGLGVML